MQRRSVAGSNETFSEGIPVKLSNPGKSLRKVNDGNIYTSKPFIILLFILIGCGVMITNQKQMADEMSNRMATLKAQYDKAAEENFSRAKQLNEISHEKERLKEESESHKNTIKENEKKVKEKVDGAENTQKLVLNRMKLMQSEIQEHSRHDVLEQFGEGPYRVEFTLEFPQEEYIVGVEDEGPTKFVIEMAPLELMPHSVHLFLEMVSHGLLDGASFHRNARHVIQAGPVPYFNSTKGVNLRKRLLDNRLVSVSFQEYHEDFPHKKYTLGFAGRPGGPDFYVSTVDNTLNHGPGGQTSYALPSEADPCFAKVISGFETVDRVHQGPVKPGWYNALEQNVGIKQVKILKE